MSYDNSIPYPLVLVPAVLLLIQLPANAAWKGEEDSPSAWVRVSTHHSGGKPGQGSWLLTLA